MKRFFAFCAGVLLLATQLVAQTTYFYRGGAVTDVNSWRTTRNGASGSAPAAFSNASDSWDFNETNANISGWTVAGNILNTKNGGGAVTTATLTLNSNASFSIGGSITLTNMAFSIGSGSTFTFSGAAQTVPNLTYANLTIAGTGTKTAAAAIGMNGTLAINSGVTLNMGTNQLTGVITNAGTGSMQTSNTSTNPIPSNIDWTSSVFFNGAGQTVPSGSYENLVLTGTGTKTAAGVITINTSFIIGANATFNTSASNYTITLKGNFSSAGTFTANGSDILISGTKDQTIAGFTTTGRVTMDKTAGKATFSSGVTAAALTLNGAGGTLNMGTGLTHNISTNWVVTAGIMEVNTSTINVGGTVDLTLAGGGVGAPGGDAEINGNAGTVRFTSPSVAQQVPAGTYFNLELAGGGNARKKTIGGGVTIQNNLNVASDAWLELGDNNITVGAAGNTAIVVDGTVVVNGLGQMLKTPGGGSEKLQLNASGKLNLTANGAGLPAFDTYTFDPLSTVTYGAGGNQSISTAPAYGILAATNGGTKGHAASLTAHAIVIGAGTTLATTGASTVLTVQGADATGSSWDNSGTYSPEDGSTVLFSGNVLQTIKGSATTTFSKLAVNKAAGLLQLNSHVNVAATLQLQNGKIATGAQSITLQNPVAASQLTGGSATAYIYSTGAGRLRRNNLPAGAGAHAFPVGTASLYMPVTVEPLDASSDFAVNTFQGLTQDGTPSGAAFVNKNPVVDAIWNIDRPTGSGEAEIKISWDASLEGSAFSTFANNQIGISHFTGGSWQMAMGSGDNIANTATYSFTSFSPFAVGKTGTVLPVSFMGIKAFEKQGGAQVEWTVAADEQVATYHIERSGDGQNFSKIGAINARQSAVQAKYEFFDQAALQGTSYYRIVSVEKNGALVTSQVIRLNLKKSGKETILYPNPVKGNYFSLQSSNLDKGRYNIRMMNANGQQLLQLRVEHSGGALSQIIRMPANLQPGLYHVQMENSSAPVQTWKLWVQ